MREERWQEQSGQIWLEKEANLIKLEKQEKSRMIKYQKVIKRENRRMKKKRDFFLRGCVQ